MYILEEFEQLKNKVMNLNNLLDRKIEILTQVLNITDNQKMFFNNLEKENLEEYINISLEEKQNLINQLIEIDTIFLSIFESFSGSLNKNKDAFKNDIKKLQDKIKYITDIDIKIRLQEEKNKPIFINIQNYNKSPKIKVLKASKEYMLKRYTENTKKNKEL